MTDWREIKISDLGSIVTGKTPPTSKPEFYGGKIQFLTPTDMDGRRCIQKTLRYLSEEGVDKVRSSLLPKGSVAVSCIGSDMGKAVIVGSDSVTNQQINSIIVSDGYDELFVYYNLSGRKNEIQFLASGAAQPIMNKTAFSNLPISVPPVEVQKAIASVLGALDDKIENNRRMNETLEEMARAIFKSWFVDFDPVHAKAAGNAPVHMNADTAALFPSSFGDDGLPTGWETSKFEDLIEFRNGYAFKSKELSKDLKSDFAIFKMGHIKVGGGFNPNYKTDHLIPKASPKMKEFILKTGDILMSMTDMKDNVRLLGHTALFYEKDANFLVNQRVGLIKAKKEITNYPYIYCLTNNQTFLYEIRKRANSGVQVNLSTVGIKTTPTIMPPLSLMAKFGSLSIPIFERIFESERESKTLAELRDTLLPKLMSGEIRVADAEREVEEAAI